MFIITYSNYQCYNYILKITKFTNIEKLASNYGTHFNLNILDRETVNLTLPSLSPSSNIVEILTKELDPITEED